MAAGQPSDTAGASDDTASKATTAVRDAFGKITSVIQNAVDELTYLEVLTATGNTNVQITPDYVKDADLLATIQRLKSAGPLDLTTMARTRIEINGDILMLMPGLQDEPENVRTDIMAIHQQNVAVAVQNWNNFLNTMLEALRVVTMMTDPAAASSLQNLKINFISSPQP